MAIELNILSNIENIIGSGNRDFLAGDNHNNILKGYNGNDLIKGMGGNDTLDGGLGTDTAVYSGSIDDYEVTQVNANTQTVRNIHSNETDTLIDIESISYEGSGDGNGGPPSGNPGNGNTAEESSEDPSGAGASFGDPHLITFDGLKYDLQKPGEYILAKSTVDDFEVQARHELWGNSNKVSVNTALSTVINGIKVGVYLPSYNSANDGVVTLPDDFLQGSSGGSGSFVAGLGIGIDDTINCPSPLY